MYQLLIHDPRNEISTANLGSIKVTITRDDHALISALCLREWDAIVTFGEGNWSTLNAQPYFTRRRWVHLPSKPDDAALIETCKNCYWGYTRPGTYKIPFVSITTPVHNAAAFILETARTVQAQTWTNFEWVVVDDGSSDASVAMLEALRDPRIRIFKMQPIGRIGYLKNLACSLARGDYLVELDHDDFLLPHALETIVKAFQTSPDAGMVYSNCAEWYAGTTEFNVYNVPYWTYRDTPWNGLIAKESLQHDAMGMYSFDGNTVPVMDAMNVCPNHVRAFRAETLRKIGGYRDLVWADDYDVMIRMFLECRIHHIPELLYVQRMGTNTWVGNAKLLWPCFGEIRSHYAERLEARYRELGLQRIWATPPAASR